jgi:hypothetical protein
VLGLVLLYVFFWIVLVVFFWAATLWFQGYIYSEPASDMHWRALATGTALALFMAFWGFLDFKSPGRYQALWDFTAREITEPYKQLWAVKEKKEVLYKMSRNENRLPVYYDDRHKPFPSRVDAVLVEENGTKVRFDIERDNQGKIKVETGQYVRYIDPQGRVMTEDSMGRLSIFHWGWFLANMFLNLTLLIVWFVALWLILQFQWPHAFGLAFVFWLMMTILIVPMLLNQVEKVAKTPTSPPAEAAACVSPWDDPWRRGDFRLSSMKEQVIGKGCTRRA